MAARSYITSFGALKKCFFSHGRGLSSLIFFLLLVSAAFPQANDSAARTNRNNYEEQFSRALADCRFEKAMEYNEKFYSIALKNKNQDDIFCSLSDMFELNRLTGNHFSTSAKSLATEA